MIRKYSFLTIIFLGINGLISSQNANALFVESNTLAPLHSSGSSISISPSSVLPRSIPGSPLKRGSVSPNVSERYARNLMEAMGSERKKTVKSGTSVKISPEKVITTVPSSSEAEQVLPQTQPVTKTATQKPKQIEAPQKPEQIPSQTQSDKIDLEKPMQTDTPQESGGKELKIEDKSSNGGTPKTDITPPKPADPDMPNPSEKRPQSKVEKTALNKEPESNGKNKKDKDKNKKEITKQAFVGRPHLWYGGGWSKRG